MERIVLQSHEKNGLRYELVADEVDPAMFESSSLESYTTQARIEVRPANQTKQGS